MPPQAIYFDLGNVLLGFSHERMCRQIAQVAGVSPKVVRDVVFDSAIQIARSQASPYQSSAAGASGDQQSMHSLQWRYEVGQIDADAYYEHFCRCTGTRPHRRRLELAASDIFWQLDDSLELVQRLVAAGNRLGILSNINSLHWNFVTSGRFPALERVDENRAVFQWPVLSFRVGSMKPDREIYDAAVQLAGADAASEVMFIDDRADNVAGALAAGLDAVIFAGVEKLTADLRVRGVPGV